MIEKKVNKDINAFINEKELEIPLVTPFTDTNEDAVVKAYTLGIVEGIGGGLFAPDKSITRQEAAKMLTSAAKVLGYKTNQEMPNFNDNNEIANWAKPYIGYISKIKVMIGGSDNKFQPKDIYQRQMAYMTMDRVMNNLE